MNSNRSGGWFSEKAQEDSNGSKGLLLGDSFKTEPPDRKTVNTNLSCQHVNLLETETYDGFSRYIEYDEEEENDDSEDSNLIIEL